MAMKLLSVDQLMIGMYILGLDSPGQQQASLNDKQRIESQADITQLRAQGIRYVIIDPTLGRDVATDPGAQPVAAEPQGQGKTRQPSTSPPKELEAFTLALEEARTIRTEALTVVQSIFEGVKIGAPINSVTVKQTVHTLMEQVLHNHDALLCLSHMREFDASLFTHVLNVCVFSLVVGKRQGFVKLQCEHLGMGALLHDVGKMRLPYNLLHKQGAYTEQERHLMQQHPKLGVAVLSRFDHVHEESLRIVMEHHERLDGSGYPAGRKGLDISPLSEIVSIADVYDAMLSSRRGRPALLPAQAVKGLYQCGLRGEFDPRWVERVIHYIGIYPVGSLVELSTGERGIVIATHPVEALRPSVKIIWDASQRRYAMSRYVSLSTPGAHEPVRTIVRALDPDQENLNMSRELA